MKKAIIFLFLPVLAIAGWLSPQSGFSKLSGPYLGQKPPGATGEIFAPGFVSTGLNESVIAFTPDGLECYWTVTFSGSETIVTSRCESGRWTEPEVAPFSGQYWDGWPAIQADGRRMFFHSSRPLPGKSAGKSAEFNIWVVERNALGWSEPRPVGAPVNGEENAACPSVTRDGTIYLSKRFADKSEKICRARPAAGGYRELEILPVTINTTNDNFHATISPDETYLVRPLYGRKDAIGGGWNYYVSFRDGDDRWSELANLGPGVNSARCGGIPALSADGKYLFYQAWTAPKYTRDRERRFNFKELVENEMRYPTGNTFDIYWIDARIIGDLRPKGEK